METRRERIVREIERRMATMRNGQPTGDPYLTTFEAITRGSSLEGLHKTVRCGLAILDTEESKVARINCMEATLRVVMEFFAWVDNAQGKPSPSTVGNRLLGDIQRRLREDLHLTEPDDGRPLQDRQLSENLVESGSQLFIDGVQDTQITGAVTFVVLYKHGINDPRELVSSLA